MNYRSIPSNLFYQCPPICVVDFFVINSYTYFPSKKEARVSHMIDRIMSDLYQYIYFVNAKIRWSIIKLSISSTFIFCVKAFYFVNLYYYCAVLKSVSTDKIENIYLSSMSPSNLQLIAATLVKINKNKLLFLLGILCCFYRKFTIVHWRDI